MKLIEPFSSCFSSSSVITSSNLGIVNFLFKIKWSWKRFKIKESKKKVVNESKNMKIKWKGRYWFIKYFNVSAVVFKKFHEYTNTLG